MNGEQLLDPFPVRSVSHRAAPPVIRLNIADDHLEFFQCAQMLAQGGDRHLSVLGDVGAQSTPISAGYQIAHDGGACPVAKSANRSLNVSGLILGADESGHKDHSASLPDASFVRTHTVTRERVDAMSWDEHTRLAHDPEAQARLEDLVEDRERRESVASYDYPTRNLSDEDLAWIRGENQDGQTSSLPEGRTSDARVSQNDWARQQYDDYVAVQYDRAMIATNGQMVNEAGRLAGVDSYSLFSGPVARVKKYGTEELQGFFGQNGRHTFKSFRYSLFKWRSDYKAHENAKNEDFGHVPHVTQHTY